mgnify:CR=1 FL=1
MALDQKPRYYYTAVVAKLSIFSHLVLRKRILIKRTPVRGKYVRQLSESFDFHFFFHALAWCCQVCQSFIAAPKELLCQLDMYFFPSHLYKNILSIKTNIFIISAFWIGKWKICSQSLSKSWKKNPPIERWRLSLQNTSGSWIGF